MNEFHLVTNGMKAVMRYCYWCGGRLPESKRHEFFSEPSDTEKEEVAQLLREAQTIDDARAILGDPDDTFDENAGGGSLLKWKRCLRYSRRWQTLVLDVLEMPNGTISYLFCGQFTGDPTDGNGES
jgi:hypothetical protein